MFRAPGTQATLRGVGVKVVLAYPTTVVQGAPGKNTEHRPKPPQLLSPSEVRVVDWTCDRTDVLMLIVPGEAFSIYLMWGTGTRCLDCWYINLQEPIRRTSIGFDGKIALPGNVTVGAHCMGIQKGSCQVQVRVPGN